MTKRIVKTMSVAVCAMALATGVGRAAATLPFIDSFDTYTAGSSVHGQGSWTATIAVGKTADVQATDKVEGPNGCTTSMADLTLNIGAGYGNAWCRVVAKPTPYDDANGSARPTITTDDGVVFYLADRVTDQIVVRSGTGWSEYTPPASADGWYTFVVHIDYANDSWDLYASGGAANYLGECTRLNAASLAFNSGYIPSQLSSFTVKGIATLDAVAMARDHRALPATSKAKVVVNAQQMSANTLYQVGLMGYGYTALENTLASYMGADLRLWLDVDDSVTLYENGQQIYGKINDSTWDTSEATLATSDAHISPGTGVWITKKLTGPFVSFSDYDNLTPPAPKAVLGTGSGGMNLLCWDKAVASQSGGTGAFGFSGTASAKDRIYLLINGQYTMLYWSGNAWRDGAGTALQTLTPGQVFWYYRGSATGNGTWNIETAQ